MKQKESKCGDVQSTKEEEVRTLLLQKNHDDCYEGVQEPIEYQQKQRGDTIQQNPAAVKRTGIATFFFTKYLNNNVCFCSSKLSLPLNYTLLF